MNLRTVVLACVIAWICAPSLGCAQSNPYNYRLSPLGLRWNSSEAACRSSLEQREYSVAPVESPGQEGMKYLKMTGREFNTPSQLYCVFHDGVLVKVVLALITPDEEAIAKYGDVRSSLVSKYGSPDGDYRTFTTPYYEGDGYEGQAIKMGKAKISAYWTEWEGESLGIEITKALTVSLSYEGPGWPAAYYEIQARQRDRL